MTFNLETRTEEGEASASENTFHSKGSKRKEGPEKRESSKKKQKVNPDHPSSASSRHEKEIGQDEDQREKKYEIDESMESTIQNDIQDKGGTLQQSSSQSLPLQVCDNDQQEERNDDEATSSFRGEQPLPEEMQVKEGKSSIPDWLRERLAREVVVEEEEQVFDLEFLLSKSQDGIEKKKATKISKVIRDDIGSRKILLATPVVDKYDDEIMAEEYDLETFYLGPLTYEQAMEDAIDSTRAVNDKLKEEIEKNKRLEKEINAWRNYFSQLNEPLGRQDLVVSPLQVLPLESINQVEKMNLAQLMDTWIDRSYMVAKEYVRRRMKTIHRAIQVLEIIHNLVVTVDAFTHTRDITIPVLQIVRKTSRQVLAQEKIVDGGTHNLLQWSTLLQMKGVLFKDINSRCSQVEDTIHPIQDKVFDVLCAILDRRIEIETDVDIQELEDRIKVIFCREDNMITEKQRDQMYTTMFLIERTKELEHGWEMTLLAAFDEVLHLEERMKNLPEIPIA